MVLNSGESRKMTISAPSGMLSGSGQVVDLRRRVTIPVKENGETGQFEVEIAGAECLVLTI